MYAHACTWGLSGMRFGLTRDMIGMCVDHGGRLVDAFGFEICAILSAEVRGRLDGHLVDVFHLLLFHISY